MSATRYRNGWLPVFLLAAFFGLALGGETAWAAVAESHSGGHVGGFGGGDRLGTAVARGGESGGGRFARGRLGDHRARGHHGRRGVFPYAYAYPDEYDLDGGYDAYNQSPRGYPNAGHCDVSTQSYPQYCVWKDGM